MSDIKSLFQSSLQDMLSLFQQPDPNTSKLAQEIAYLPLMLSSAERLNALSPGDRLLFLGEGINRHKELFEQAENNNQKSVIADNLRYLVRNKPVLEALSPDQAALFVNNSRRTLLEMSEQTPDVSFKEHIARKMTNMAQDEIVFGFLSKADNLDFITHNLDAASSIFPQVSPKGQQKISGDINAAAMNSVTHSAIFKKDRLPLFEKVVDIQLGMFTETEDAAVQTSLIENTSAFMRSPDIHKALAKRDVGPMALDTSRKIGSLLAAGDLDEKMQATVVNHAYKAMNTMNIFQCLPQNKIYDFMKQGMDDQAELFKQATSPAAQKKIITNACDLAKDLDVRAVLGNEYHRFVRDTAYFVATSFHEADDFETRNFITARAKEMDEFENMLKAETRASAKFKAYTP